MLKKGTPGEGWSARSDSFSYTPVQTGMKSFFTAWLAGEPYWALAHEHTDRTPGTKPCLDWLTDGALRCPRCRGPKLPAWIGWVPLYREQDHQPILVIIHSNAHDLVSGLRYPDHVIVGRVNDTSGVFVRKSDSAIPFRTESAARKKPVDIRCHLVPMWKLPELETWIERQQKAQRRAQREEENPTNLRLSVPPPTTDTERAAIDAHKNPPSDWVELVEQATGNLKRGIISPSRNGHHEGET